jgi:hypothetical protein
LDLAHAWFRFNADGVASLTLRYRDAEYLLTTAGQWRLEGANLSVTLGESTITAPVVVEEDVMRWAGEVMTRAD